jgi:predicted CXXCH cytochrome family protein
LKTTLSNVILKYILYKSKKEEKEEMKNRLIGIGILVGFGLSILMATGAFAAKDEIVFDASMGKVTFTHKKHSETLKIDCLKCHHTWKQGETSGKKCTECHKAAAEGSTPSIKDASHKTCKGCHDEAKKADKPAGPTGCTQCHVKK